MHYEIQRANERGHANHWWLNTYHSFSFANYYNPDKLHFGALQVLNDDTVAGGKGFPTHPHDNMEIITIPLVWAIAHKDSMWVVEEVGSDGVQVMSAGSWLTHSEFNASSTETAHFLQLRITPHTKNIQPRHDSRTFNPANRKNVWQLLVSPDASNGSLMINQYAYISRSQLSSGTSLQYDLYNQGNGIYIFVISGKIHCEKEQLTTGDAIAIHPWHNQLVCIAEEESDVLIIEVPME